MTIPIVYFIICGITGLILWIYMLQIIENKGNRVNYFFVRPSQYVKFWEIIKNESDNKLRKKYKKIFWWQIALIPIYLIGMFVFIEYFG